MNPTIKFSSDHDWVTVDGNKALIGISDYAQHALGDIVYVDLPKIGAALKAGVTFGSVESVKAVSDLYSPVTGTVLEINETLADAPELLNSDPYESWLIAVTPTNLGELAGLMDEAAYADYCKSLS